MLYRGAVAEPVQELEVVVVVEELEAVLLRRSCRPLGGARRAGARSPPGCTGPATTRGRSTSGRCRRRTRASRGSRPPSPGSPGSRGRRGPRRAQPGAPHAPAKLRRPAVVPDSRSWRIPWRPSARRTRRAPAGPSRSAPHRPHLHAAAVARNAARRPVSVVPPWPSATVGDTAAAAPVPIAAPEKRRRLTPCSMSTPPIGLSQRQHNTRCFCPTASEARQAAMRVTIASAVSARSRPV